MSTIPPPSEDDLKRDAEADYSPHFLCAWIRRAVAAERHCRDHHLEPCETCIANETARIAAERELQMIDNVLARRPAMDQPTRWQNVEKAIGRASQADAAERERDELRKQLEAKGRLIYDLETRCDPTGEVQELWAQKENNAALQQRIAELEAANLKLTHDNELLRLALEQHK